MYSRGDVAVDKGLGFDFSEISNLVKSALPTGLNIYQQQAQLKHEKEMARIAQAGGYVPQSPSIYGQQYNILPMSRAMQPQPTIGMPYASSSRGMDMTTMLLIGGGLLIGGLVLFKALK